MSCAFFLGGGEGLSLLLKVKSTLGGLDRGKRADREELIGSGWL